MIECIRFKTNPYKRVKLNINSKAGFNDLLATLNQIEINGAKVMSEHITYAVLELLNNSLRAHREKGIRKSITTDFSLKDGTLSIFIQDWGGGFDPSGLPYDIKKDPNQIDMHDEDFQVYREQHDYKRFGIGILIVKKTFDMFKLYFIDNNGEPVSWESGETAGTCIELEIGTNGN